VKGDYRVVDLRAVDGFDGFRLIIKHKWTDENLVYVQAELGKSSSSPIITYVEDPVDGGWYHAEVTLENCVRIFRYGIENEYRFTPTALRVISGYVQKWKNEKAAANAAPVPHG